MKKLTASLLSAALVASLAISGSAFASGTQRSAGDATDGTWDYPWYKTTATAPSYRNEAPASNAVDGNTQTHWHSNWGTGSGTGATTLTDEERYIQLELEKEVEISGVRYLPRQGTDDGVGNGRVTSCKVQVSQTGNEGDWQDATAQVQTWANDAAWKLVALDEPVSAKYIRLYGVTTVSDSGTANAFMSCAELRVQTTQKQDTNIFLGKDASASSQLPDQEANKANDGDTNTQWCANWRPDASPAADKTLRGNWWQVDLGEAYEVDELNLVFEQSATWQYHVAVSDDPAFTDYTFDDTAITTVTAAETTVDVNQAGQYVRVYVMSSTNGRWPCLKEVSGTGTVVTTPEVTEEEVRALVSEANGKLGEWYKSGWSEYSEAIANAQTVLGQTDPTAEDLAAAKQAIETAKGNLVERDQYTADDPFVFPAQGGVTTTLEAEFAQLHNEVLDSDGKWALQVAEADWASHGKYINCLNQQDTITFYYNAPVAGTYLVEAFYRSGSGTNELVWSGANIQNGTIVAGATDDAAETHTVTFNMVITKAGAGTLVFTGPDTKSPQLDKLEITLTEAAYSITVTSPVEGGTATADHTTAAAGDTVTLTPVASEGYHFVEWQVEGNAVEITDNTFTMPESNVTITPVFEAHTYGEPTFAWAEGNTSVTATFTCDREDCGHQETATAQATSAVTKQPTCTEKGVTTYTATVSFNGEQYPASKTEENVAALGHKYGEPTFSWAEDGSSATATFTCACGDEHEETAVITHEVKTPATCTEKGTTTYTATVTVDFGEGTYTSTKDVQDIPAVAHTTELQNAKEATCTTDGYTGDLVCTVCGTVVEEGETIKATGHTQETIPGKEATCTQDGLTDGVKCSVCGEILVEQEVIKATGHKFEDGVCTVCGEKDPNYVPPTQEPQGDVVLDNQTGDQITAGNADEVFGANTIITVVRVEDGETYAAVEQALKGVVADMKHTAILDITATLNGKPVQPSAPVQMTFAIPQHLSADNLKLFYVSDDGKTTQEIPITVDKDARTVTATIAHFSTYVLANVVVDETTGTVPPTGDASQLMLMTGMLLTSAAALGGLVVASRKRRG